jgi:carbon monoxide dehydrogenase subunit G
MKRLTGLFIFLISVFLVMGLLSLLLPAKVAIFKSVEINATPEKIRDQIVNFDQWKNWYPAFKDENIIVINNSPANNHNSVTLKDKQGKNTTLTIVDSSQHNIDIRIHSSSSTKVNYRFIIIPKKNNQTLVTWNIETDLGWYPWKRIQGIFLDKISGDQFETALSNLKKATEN